MVTDGRATCIVLSDDDLPPEGSDHTHPLYISVGCSGHRVPSIFWKMAQPCTYALWPLPSPSVMRHLTLVSPLRQFEPIIALGGRLWALWRLNY